MKQYANDGAFDPPAFRSMYVKVYLMALVPVFLALVLWFMGNGGWDGEPASFSPLIVAWCAVLGLASLPFGVWQRKRVLAQTGDFVGQKNSWSSQKTYKGVEAVTMRLKAGAVSAMAMPIQSAAFGFILGFKLQSWLYFLPFAAYSVLGMIILYPRQSQMQAWYQRQMAAIGKPGDIGHVPVPPQPL